MDRYLPVRQSSIDENKKRRIDGQTEQVSFLKSEMDRQNAAGF